MTSLHHMNFPVFLMIDLHAKSRNVNVSPHHEASTRTLPHRGQPKHFGQRHLENKCPGKARGHGLPNAVDWKMAA